MLTESCFYRRYRLSRRTEAFQAAAFHCVSGILDGGRECAGVSGHSIGEHRNKLHRRSASTSSSRSSIVTDHRQKQEELQELGMVLDALEH